ncbi:MAG: chromate efflux transporter [Pseudomonadota bacterium]|nr:chromate efflux transporter [Pseudomonadota bacterium]MEC8666399.1 chromate efflux transporter [Pseudomonadota bacterium]
MTPPAKNPSQDPRATWPTLGEATGVWARVAALSFGGPAGQMAVMHRIVVEEKRWIGDARFLHALNFCMLLPGPEAQQLATYIGWLMHGTRGAVIAGGLFILPGVLAILGLSWIYVLWGDVPLVEGVFFGLKAAVLAIVVQALLRISSRALKTPAMRGIAVLSFVGIFALQMPFPLIVALAALAGYLGARAGFAGFAPGGGHGAQGGPHLADADSLLGDEAATQGTAGRRGALVAGLAALVLWLVPVVALVLLAGPGNVFADIALFFSKMAVVTFGGAYAVLAYVGQEAVGTYGWLNAGQMLDGLGMAETTPGPLIMVLQFVGFLGAWSASGDIWIATLGALLTTWVTFAPCFAWIFLGAPWMERLRANRGLSAALTAVTAAVVGVILNLALWFAIHVIFTQVTTWTAGPVALELPRPASVDWAALALTLLALVAVLRLKLGMATVLGGAALAGVVLTLLG